MSSDLVKLEVSGLGARGDGLAYHDGQLVYLPSCVPGDIVEVRFLEQGKKTPSIEVLQLIKSSPKRVEPECRHFDECGGCSLQHFNDETYREWARDRVKMALLQQGLADNTVQEASVVSRQSRRRVSLKARKIKNKVILGFNKSQSHTIVPITECPVACEAIVNVFKPLADTLNQVLPTGAQGDVFITNTETGLDLLFDISVILNLDMRERLTSFAMTYDIAALHWRGDGYLDPVIIQREPIMRFDGVAVKLPPAGFVQASGEAEKILSSHVLDACGGRRAAVDLFAGIGTFTFPLAGDRKVLAVEGALSAVKALQVASTRQTRKDILVEHRDLFRNPVSVKELNNFDSVIMNPPRAGALEQVKELVKSDIDLIIYVSCNSNTFSRDAKLFIEHGFLLDSIKPVAQFLWSIHVELVGVFKR